jgi:hypothetical protein
MKFTVEVYEAEGGIVRAFIQREDGQTRDYLITRKKLLLFSSLNGSVKDAIDFLLGETD